ncbi:MAG: radical SAM protein [Pseudomonadota bacterium]|nr:radical SAM protein [Pseudomonadota bacterium]
MSVNDHSRDAAGLHHVYPVLSRRAGGLSIGINLNTNNACNWACSYCQVPGLTRGAAPAIDVGLLARELNGFLAQVVEGDFLATRLPEGMRRVNDIAFSGNGEPTASPAFAAACDVVLAALDLWRGLADARVVVISNGSLLHQAPVQQALARLARRRGELWFKLDRGLEEQRRRVNGVQLPDQLVLERLLAASAHIPTWVQTCLFAEGGAAPEERERLAWLQLIAEARRQGARLAGVLLYTLARPSLQPGAEHLAPLPAAALEAWAQPLRSSGLEVRVSA